MNLWKVWTLVRDPCKFLHASEPESSFMHWSGSRYTMVCSNLSLWKFHRQSPHSMIDGYRTSMSMNHLSTISFICLMVDVKVIHLNLSSLHSLLPGEWRTSSSLSLSSTSSTRQVLNGGRCERESTSLHVHHK